MNKHADAEPFFITEEVEADMRAAGYVFEPPTHTSATRLSNVLGSVSDVDLAVWPGEIAERKRARRKGNQA